MKCRKVRFRDRIAAELVIASRRNDQRREKNERWTYYCKDCRAWHLTSRR